MPNSPSKARSISANIVDGAANGISIVNFDRAAAWASARATSCATCRPKAPTSADPPGFGVGITVEADSAVTGNVVENAPLYGMKIGWGAFMRNVVATGNVIRKAGTGIAVSVVEGAGSAVISDNVIDGAKSGAIIGHRWAEPRPATSPSAGQRAAIAHLDGRAQPRELSRVRQSVRSAPAGRIAPTGTPFRLAMAGRANSTVSPKAPSSVLNSLRQHRRDRRLRRHALRRRRISARCPARVPGTPRNRRLPRRS